jgi:hypothetical protein
MKRAKIFDWLLLDRWALFRPFRLDALVPARIAIRID